METWRQELKQGLWRGANYWLALGGLLSLLSSVLHDHLPRGGTIHIGMGGST